MNERSLLETRDVKRWYDNLAEGSPKTAETYLWWLRDYCSKVEMVPTELVSEFNLDKKAAQDRLEDYVRSLKARISPYDKKPLKPKTVNGALCAVKSWLRVNECEVTREIKIANVKTTPTIEDEHFPSTEELNTILDHANQRTRAAIVMIAYAGIRPEAVSRLRLKDFPELEIHGKIVARRTPMRISVRAELSKNKRPYFTFLIRRGVDVLTAYLRERQAGGEELTQESPVIAVFRNLSIKNEFMRTSMAKPKGAPMGRKAVSALMRRAIRSSDTSVSKFRPYVLRSYYDWALQNAGLSHVWEQFFMGHSGPIEEEYSVRKRLTDEQVELMRKAFSEKVEAKLVGIQRGGLTREEVEKEARVQYYWLGINDSPLKERSSEELVKTEEARLGRGLDAAEKLVILEREYRELRKEEVTLMEAGTESLAPEKVESQKIIGEDELSENLAQGWAFVASLPSGKVVVKK
ncbi:MAG: site-specific integrase [Nitrososphaerota archaeon]|jgi:integrase|nr:site-specific integrase [Nitrososphaerota archaeon]MDG6942285.1 site-specific integrase [Nitrososphaerota archaeon]MDG6942750.1 site-specific integrase [Nitrososphaerota archaeon]MDG6948537.1 site-specific integrase [Nitrososphaerota archaeon]MDG6950463.1 site-specific integrase [Nitrososphaerota archaeon]